METILNTLSGALSSIGPFFLLLGLLIFVHELGHYLVAVYYGVRVETFSLGFGKKLFQTKRGNTTYCVSLIPLGGYVKMFGDDPSQNIPESEKQYSFLHKPVWPRIAIVLAGPLMNLFFATLIFALIGLLGENVPGPKLGDISPDTAAYAAGFRSGDTILEVGRTEVKKWKAIQEVIEVNPNQLLQFKIRREASIDGTPGEIVTVAAEPKLAKNDFIFTTRREIGKIEGLDIDSRAPIVSLTSSETPAARGGFTNLDYIHKINGKEIFYFREIEAHVRKELTSGDVKLDVGHYEHDRESKERRTVTISATKELSAADDILAAIGITTADLTLFQVKKDSPASRAGLQVGDQIVAIDGKKLLRWDQILESMKGYSTDKENIKVIFRRNGVEQEVALVPEEIELPTEQGAMEKRYAIGVVPAIATVANDPFLQKADGLGSALVYGASQSLEWSKFIGLSFVRLIQNEVSAKNIGGIITIGRVASRSFEAGLDAFLKMMAIISINLFLLNLLPVPVLDGGHLVFFTIEAIKGTPLSLRKMEVAQQVGLVLLLALMVFALFNDITHLLSAW